MKVTGPVSTVSCKRSHLPSRNIARASAPLFGYLLRGATKNTTRNMPSKCIRSVSQYHSVRSIIQAAKPSASSIHLSSILLLAPSGRIHELQHRDPWHAHVSQNPFNKYKSIYQVPIWSRIQIRKQQLRRKEFQTEISKMKTYLKHIYI